MTSGLGNGIDKALKDLDDNPIEEPIAYDDPEVCAIIRDIHAMLSPHLHEIQGDITYCDDMEVLDHVISLYYRDTRLQRYPIIITLPGQSGAYANTKHFPLHYLKTIKLWTRNWFKMTDAERSARYDLSRRAEAQHKWLKEELAANGDRICGYESQGGIDRFIYKNPLTNERILGRPFHWHDGK